MAEKETRDTTQDPTAEKGQLDTAELEAIVGGNDPTPPMPEPPTSKFTDDIVDPDPSQAG